MEPFVLHLTSSNLRSNDVLELNRYKYETEDLCLKASVIFEHIISGLKLVSTNNLKEIEHLAGIHNVLIKLSEPEVRLAIHWMNDNHTFKEIKGNNIDEIRQSICDITSVAGVCGMVCPIIVIFNDKELRRVGECVSFYKDQEFVFSSNLNKWQQTVMEDPDIKRILTKKE